MKKTLLNTIIGVAGFMVLGLMTAIMVANVVTGVVNAWGLVAVGALALLTTCWTISWFTVIKEERRKSVSENGRGV